MAIPITGTGLKPLNLPLHPMGWRVLLIGAVPSARNINPPNPEHPDTPRDVPEAAIHANPLEAHNAALRRRNSAFRHRTNTYAKNADALQRTLDVHLLQHNFVRPHWTTGEVPTVRLGIMAAPLRLEEILIYQRRLDAQATAGQSLSSLPALSGEALTVV